MKNQSNREKRNLKTRKTILDTALNLISEKGLGNFSMREVARRMEYSAAGLYEYFGSKEDLLKELAREGERRLSILMRSVPRTFSPDEYLIELCMKYIEFARTNTEHFVLMNAHVSERGSMEEQIPKNSSYNTLVQGVLQAAKKNIIVFESDFGLEEIAYSIWAFVHGMAMLVISHLNGFQADFDTINRTAIRKFIKGLE